MRSSPITNKTNCLVIDFGDNISGSDSMEIIPTLYGTSIDKLPASVRSRTLIADAEDDGEVIMVDEEWLANPLKPRFEHRVDLLRAQKEAFFDLADPLRRAKEEGIEFENRSRNAWVGDISHDTCWMEAC